MPLGPVSVELKIAIPCLVLGGVLFLVSFAEPHWFGNEAQGMEAYYGLWKACAGAIGAELCLNYDGSTALDWQKGVNGLECICLVGMAVALSLSVLLLFKNQKTLSLLASLVAILAGVLGLIGAIVFAVKTNDLTGHLAWAFFLNIAGDIFIGIGGGALLVNAIRMSTGYITLP